MALALTLGHNETPPERLQVSAACTLDVEGAPKITAIDLIVRARVPKLDDADFEHIVQQAERLGPVSNALRGNVSIDVRHELERA